MGDISDRSLFRHVVLEKALIAYFDIDKGKIYLPLSLLTTFNSSHQLSAHCSFRMFEDDNTYTLIFQLCQNVIKTGIRRLSLAYSRISLWAKPRLDSEEDAEYFIGKAIRDGVIEGRLRPYCTWERMDGIYNTEMCLWTRSQQGICEVRPWDSSTRVHIGKERFRS